MVDAAADAAKRRMLVMVCMLDEMENPTPKVEAAGHFLFGYLRFYGRATRDGHVWVLLSMRKEKGEIVGKRRLD